MSSLFNEDEMYNEKGTELSQEIHPFIKETLEKWRGLGYKSNEIVQIIYDEINCTDAELRIMSSIKKRRLKRANSKKDGKK